MIVNKDGEIIGKGYNQVLKTNDPTWHAEMQAIREACKKMGSPHLTGCTLYTSAECCPMCLAAVYLADIKEAYYGATIPDSRKYGDFQDDNILEEIRLDPNKRKIKFTEFMRPEAVKIWIAFSKMPNRGHY